MMAKAEYRPGDGMGGINLSEEELFDDDLLLKEAVEYATRFREEEDSLSFRIGLSNYRTNRAFVLAIEAARLLCGGGDADEFALRLLKLAVKEIEAAPRDGKN